MNLPMLRLLDTCHIHERPAVIHALSSLTYCSARGPGVLCRAKHEDGPRRDGADSGRDEGFAFRVPHGGAAPSHRADSSTRICDSSCSIFSCWSWGQRCKESQLRRHEEETMSILHTCWLVVFREFRCMHVVFDSDWQMILHAMRLGSAWCTSWLATESA